MATILAVDDEQLVEEMIRERPHRSRCKTASFNDPKKVISFVEQDLDTIDFVIVHRLYAGYGRARIGKRILSLKAGLPDYLITGSVKSY